MADPHSTHAKYAERNRLEPLLTNLARRAIGHKDPAVRAEIRTLLKRGDSAGAMSPAERERLALEIRRFCHLHNMPEVLALSGVPAVYNFQEPYERNARGPWDRVPDFDGVTPGRRWKLMGFDIGYPVGIPASVLTVNARFIDYYARQGFNVITYKTVRSRHWDAHPFPNWVYLEGLSSPLPVEGGIPSEPCVGDSTTYLSDPTSFSTANSFGVPSERPEVWKADVADSIGRLADGKLLIVSVMGSSEREDLREPAALAEDFAAVAEDAQAAGARAIELNLSCPNTLDADLGEMTPPICLDPDLTAQIVHRVADVLAANDPSTRLVAKLGWMKESLLENVIQRFAARVHCVSGINTLPVEVVDHAGRPTFGQRTVGGVSGIAIRDFGRAFVRSVARLREKHEWDFDLIGMGGVMDAEDVRVLLHEGADAVQTATAAAHNPTLPWELLGRVDGDASTVTRAVLGVLDQQPGTDAIRLAATIGTSVSAVRWALRELETQGLVRATASDVDRPGYRIDSEALERQLS